VERDLDAETARVTDVGTGADLTDRFDRDASGVLQLGRQLLGVSRDIYTNTACISRSEVMRLEDAGSIKEVIVALADSAHPDRTAQRVLDRLRQERVHRIGKPRGRSGPLHDLESRLAELERQLGAAREAQEEFERRAADVAPQVRQLEAERAKLDADAQGYETRARGIDSAALTHEPVVRELLSALNVGDAQAPEGHLRAQTAAED